MRLKGLELLAIFLLFEEETGEAIDGFWDALGRMAICSNRKSQRFDPTDHEDHLEVRHGVAITVAGHTVEANIGNVVLTAAVKAAGNLYPQAATASSISPALAAKRVRSSPAKPRLAEIPSLQVSVPGQEVTSMIVSEPGLRGRQQPGFVDIHQLVGRDITQHHVLIDDSADPWFRQQIRGRYRPGQRLGGWLSHRWAGDFYHSVAGWRWA